MGCAIGLDCTAAHRWCRLKQPKLVRFLLDEPCDTLLESPRAFHGKSEGCLGKADVFCRQFVPLTDGS